MKLTFTYKGRQWQVEGEDHQILGFLSSFPEGTLEPSHAKPIQIEQKPRPKAKSKYTVVTTLESMLDQPSVPDEEIKRYLLSKPNYDHDLFEVQEHFYGRRFISRGIERRLYHRTHDQLLRIRQALERDQHGKFIMTKGNLRGQKRYVFEPLQTVTPT